MKVYNAVRSIFKRKKPVLEFPYKTGTNVFTCTPLLAVHGALFCVDNKNILFKDDKDNTKVLKPYFILPRTEGDDFDSYNEGDGFVIRYEEADYFYMAHFECIERFGCNIIKIKDIKQDILNTFEKAGRICVQERGEVV